MLYANSGDPDQTPRYAASDLDLHYLPMSHENDARIIWAKTDRTWMDPESSVRPLTEFLIINERVEYGLPSRSNWTPPSLEKLLDPSLPREAIGPSLTREVIGPLRTQLLLEWSRRNIYPFVIFQREG